MKRLVKKFSSLFLYHGTSIENLKQITQSQEIIPQGGVGIGVGVNNGNNDAVNNFQDFIFLAATPFTALTYASRASSNNLYCVVLKISVDENKLLPDDNDCSECQTWQESLNEIRQVKYQGSIPINQISTVIFYKTTGGPAVFESEFYDWEESYKKIIEE